MATKRTVQIGNPAIRTKSVPVPLPASASVKKIVRDLVDSMRANGLVGMAAPQIGINKRIFVTEIRTTDTRRSDGRDPVRVFINPKILEVSARKTADYEGCGSVAYAGLFGIVRRANTVMVAAYGLDGKRFVLRVEGLLARIVQHEQDHLEGKVFLDRMAGMGSITGREELLKRK